MQFLFQQWIEPYKERFPLENIDTKQIYHWIQYPSGYWLDHDILMFQALDLKLKIEWFSKTIRNIVC